MGFREECDLCGRSIRVISAKDALSKRDGEVTMCKRCIERKASLDKFFESHVTKTNKKVESLLNTARKEAEEAFTQIMFERQEKRIRAIEDGISSQ